MMLLHVFAYPLNLTASLDVSLRAAVIKYVTHGC